MRLWTGSSIAAAVMATSLALIGDAGMSEPPRPTDVGPGKRSSTSRKGGDKYSGETLRRLAAERARGERR